MNPQVPKATLCLWYDHDAEDAAKFYAQTFPGSSVGAVIQSDLFYDYRTNVDAYSTWQARMRARQPNLLVLRGKYDLSFDSSEPGAYHRDVPRAQIHVLDAGHFALDTAADEIAALVHKFAGSSVESAGSGKLAAAATGTSAHQA